MDKNAITIFDSPLNKGRYKMSGPSCIVHQITFCNTLYWWTSVYNSKEGQISTRSHSTKCNHCSLLNKTRDIVQLNAIPSCYPSV